MHWGQPEHKLSGDQARTCKELGGLLHWPGARLLLHEHLLLLLLLLLCELLLLALVLLQLAHELGPGHLRACRRLLGRRLLRLQPWLGRVAQVGGALRLLAADTAQHESSAGDGGETHAGCDAATWALCCRAALCGKQSEQSASADAQAAASWLAHVPSSAEQNTAAPCSMTDRRYLSSTLGQQGLQGGALRLLRRLLLLLWHGVPVVSGIGWRLLLRCLRQMAGLLRGSLADGMVCQVRGQLLAQPQLLQQLLPLHSGCAQR